MSRLISTVYPSPTDAPVTFILYLRFRTTHWFPENRTRWSRALGSRLVSREPKCEERHRFCRRRRDLRLPRGGVFLKLPFLLLIPMHLFNGQRQCLSRSQGTNLAGLKVAHLMASPREQPVNLAKFRPQVSNVTTLEEDELIRNGGEEVRRTFQRGC
jgi:hypothetical protein